MIAKYKREFSRYVTVAVTLIAICCVTISAQERSSAGNLYVLKDFGEFRLPSSLRPMFDYQVGTGSTRSFDHSDFIATSASANVKPFTVRIDPWILAGVSTCADRPCRRLTEPIDLDDSGAKKEADQFKAFLGRKLGFAGYTLLDWKGPEVRDIGGGKAMCFAYRTASTNDDRRTVNLLCGIDNFDRRYSLSIEYAEKDRSFWEPEIAKFLESIKILDRAPKK